jgi:hypothetical protein
MDFLLPIQVPRIEPAITYADALFLTGSCFTEHIGGKLAQTKFAVHQNPNGILFDPLSVCKSLIAYIEDRRYDKTDLFFLDELWHSWDHHSRFSGMDADQVVETINTSQALAHQALKEANWLIITLGSSFIYQLVSEDHMPVANCHRAPANWFRKHLLGIDQIVAALDTLIHRLLHFNPGIRIIFTVSPVRHIRDGVIENNRSKARLLESVHHLVQKFDRLYYFPAYELVIDVLRDYRFYDIDLVHPNFSATQFVFDQFTQAAMRDDTRASMKQIGEIMTAYKHRPQQPGTQAHQRFLSAQLHKIEKIREKLPMLDWTIESLYFQAGLQS